MLGDTSPYRSLCHFLRNLSAALVLRNVVTVIRNTVTSFYFVVFLEDGTLSRLVF